MTAPPAGGRGAAISGPEWKPRLAGSAAVVTMGADGRIREFSDAAVEVFGFSREEAIGAELAELIIPPRLRAAHRTGLSRLSDRGTGPIIDNRFRMPALHRDGSEFEIELVVTRISCRGDTAYAAFIRRIQEPAVVPGELFQRAEFFRALVEEAPIEVGLLDDSGVLVWQSRTGAAGTPTSSSPSWYTRATSTGPGPCCGGRWRAASPIRRPSASGPSTAPGGRCRCSPAC